MYFICIFIFIIIFITILLGYLANKNGFSNISLKKYKIINENKKYNWVLGEYIRGGYLCS